VEPDKTNLHVLWRQTSQVLERHRKLVAEGKGVESAQQFAHYVIWSGIPKLLSQYQCEAPLKIDGPGLLRGAETLLEECRAHWRTGESNTDLVVSAVERLDRKFDLLAGAFAQLTSEKQEASLSSNLPGVVVSLPIPKVRSSDSQAGWSKPLPFDLGWVEKPSQ